MQASDRVVHVSGLPNSVTVDFLKAMFSDIGDVASVTLKQRPSGNFAFIAFNTSEQAILAQHEYNYTKLNGSTINITPTTVEYQEMIRSGEGNLFVRGLDENIEASQLHELFQTYGEVISVKLPMKDGKNRGFGYVQFKKVDDAARALEELSMATINGKQINVEKYQKRAPVSAGKNDRRAKSDVMDDNFTNVYIKNLPESISNTQELGKLFLEFGMVVSTKILADGSSGYCNMLDHVAAVRAINTLNGRILEGHVLEVTRAKSKDERMGIPGPARTGTFQAEPAQLPQYTAPKLDDLTLREIAGHSSSMPVNPYGANPIHTSSSVASMYGMNSSMAPINPYGTNPLATASSNSSMQSGTPFVNPRLQPANPYVRTQPAMSSYSINYNSSDISHRSPFSQPQVGYNSGNPFAGPYSAGYQTPYGVQSNQQQPQRGYPGTKYTLA